MADSIGTGATFTPDSNVIMSVIDEKLQGKHSDDVLDAVTVDSTSDGDPSLLWVTLNNKTHTHT